MLNSYLRNLDFSNLTDNRKFWRAIKLVFAEKIKTTPSITLEENGELISDDRKIAELFNSYFISITKELGIQQDIAHISVTDGINDPIDKAIEKYKNHQSIIKIREMYPDPQPFEFREVNSGEIWDQINKLNTRKASPIENIPAKKFLDTKQKAIALLMDLSKAFDCLNHDLLIAKLDAYGFSRGALNFISSYLSQRKQRVKMENHECRCATRISFGTSLVQYIHK